MKIKTEDIQIYKYPYEKFLPGNFEINRQVVIKRKYQIACIEKVELDEYPTYWVISNGTGDKDFLQFLSSKGILNKEYYSTFRVKNELFPLIIEFLKDKPAGYLDNRTNATTPTYVDKEKQYESQKDCYDHRGCKSFRMASVQHIRA